MARGRPAGLKLNVAAYRDLRTIRGVSPKAIHEATGISMAQLSEMEHQGKGASEDTAQKLAAVLEVTVATLFPEQFRQAGHFTFVKDEVLAS